MDSIESSVQPWLKVITALLHTNGTRPPYSLQRASNCPRCRGCSREPRHLTSDNHNTFLLPLFLLSTSQYLRPPRSRSVTSSALSVSRRYSAHGKSVGTPAEFRLEISARNPFSRQWRDILPPADVGIDFRETLSRKNQNLTQAI